MKARERNFLDFVKSSFQFEIPIYQRKYSWEQEQCEQFWQDVLSAGGSEAGSHFFGSIVYVGSNELQNAPLFVIDGQQRLTSLTLLLAALQSKLGNNESYEETSGNKIRAYYLVNEYETGERYYKLLLTDTDKETLSAVIKGNQRPDDYSWNVWENYKWFQAKIETLDAAQLKNLCRGLNKLQIVEIGLSGSDDNPQLIFESMNSKGLELAQTDLIRNYILLGLPSRRQEELYKTHWRPMEKSFGEQFSEFDKFMFAYLILKTGAVPKQRNKGIYEAFRVYCNKRKAGNANEVENIVADMRCYAEYYCNMALGKEPNRQLRAIFQNLNELAKEKNSSPLFPLLMRLYAAYKNDSLSENRFLRCLLMMESYLFRRTICGLPSNVLRNTFAVFAARKTPPDGDYLEDLRQAFSELQYERACYPGDYDFQSAFIARSDFYRMKQVKYWLRKYENFERKEYVDVEEYTIEHIMPQTLTEEWKEILGEDWEEEQRKYLHKAGNLTLTGYNSRYSNKSFTEKREMDGGFRHSPLRLNRSLAELSSWNIAEIDKRTRILAEDSAKIWPNLLQA